MWSNWNSDVLLVGIQNGAAPVEDRLAVQWAGQHPLALWPRNPTVRYLPREMKTYVHKTLYALFIMAFFIMARSRVQPVQETRPSIAEWMDMLLGRPLSGMPLRDENKLLSQVITWPHLKCTRLGERSRTPVAWYCGIPLAPRRYCGCGSRSLRWREYCNNGSEMNFLVSQCIRSYVHTIL